MTEQDMSIKNEQGKTPLDIASTIASTYELKELLEKGITCSHWN